ncbi:hypothetical protein EV182_001445, partial [Spiromyces aspiralis]
CRVIDYVVPKLQDVIYFTVEYEDRDWSGLRTILLEQYDLLDQPRYQQELDELIKEKWRLEDVAKNTNKFTYLWRRTYGQGHDDNQKTQRYLEALPKEMVWAVTGDLYNGSALQPYMEVRKIMIQQAMRILNIQKNAPEQDNEKKNMANRTMTRQRSSTVNMPQRTPTSTDYDKLADKFEKLSLQVKELKTQATKATTTTRPCLYCDEQGHSKSRCELLGQDLRAKLVFMDQSGKLTG